MAKYSLTNKAVEDLTNIWDYTLEKWNENQAEKYYEMLLYCFDQIADNPIIGKNYVEINKDLFGLKANKHIIFYRKFTTQSIEITRILHEQMDLVNRLSE